jgi:hypothetical protein
VVVAVAALLVAVFQTATYARTVNADPATVPSPLLDLMGQCLLAAAVAAIAVVVAVTVQHRRPL